MILAGGRILGSEAVDEVISTLERRICRTLQKPVLNPGIVIEACSKLAEKIEAGAFHDILSQITADENITADQINEAVHLLKRESLIYKLKTELGEDYNITKEYTPVYRDKAILKKYMPLGVLFHIGAGNVDGLPAYSVIEGLLAGNINILKLPAADKDFTIKLLSELIKLEPVLSDYIYVFDTPSGDIIKMKQIARSADAIVLWGGDSAVEAVRKLAAPNQKIIEWGHKISFAYITEKGMDDQMLAGLAHHILRTKQLLCSSCQGIYLDTDQMTSVYEFCKKFLEILEDTAKYYPEPDIGMQAQITLLLYNQELENQASQKRIFRGKRCSITAAGDRKLEVSCTCGNCWAKPLPKDKIISSLHRYKGYLQTAGLLCAPEEREELSLLLLRAGATRVTSVSDMSRMLCGESHDGVYPLRRYSKITEYDK